MISYIFGLVSLWIVWLPNNRACITTIPSDDMTDPPIVCQDPAPLFSSPDEFVKIVIPAANTNGATTPVGGVVTVTCENANTNPALIGSGLTVSFDTNGQNVQNFDNFNGGFEQFTLTCQSSGLWFFDIFGDSVKPGPAMFSGIVSTPGAALCQGCYGQIAPYCH
uniref:C6 domain-containing protein n=1 Tax=Plectus sambesii TaxID=2011161 RepID=A0A914VAZ3_9BILA